MNFEATEVRIARKLTAAFAPIDLEIKDESKKHVGHTGARPGQQTHFKVRIVSEAFRGLSKVARHRAVYVALAGEMDEGGIHALQLETLAPGE